MIYKGSNAAEWVLNGYFVRQTFVHECTDRPSKIEGTVTMSYDLAKKSFRKWIFASNGQMTEYAGVWDTKSRTMTWAHEDASGGVSRVQRTTFIDNDTENWTEVIKNPDGKVIAELSGTNKRRKKR